MILQVLEFVCVGVGRGVCVLVMGGGGGLAMLLCEVGCGERGLVAFWFCIIHLPTNSLFLPHDPFLH